MSEGPDIGTSEVCILQLTAANRDRWTRLIAAAVHATECRLYAFFDGTWLPLFMLGRFAGFTISLHTRHMSGYA